MCRTLNVCPTHVVPPPRCFHHACCSPCVACCPHAAAFAPSKCPINQQQLSESCTHQDVHQRIVPHTFSGCSGLVGRQRLPVQNAELRAGGCTCKAQPQQESCLQNREQIASWQRLPVQNANSDPADAP
eukprot:1141188-Pelagomonas_calceolata.AAC.2